MAEESEDRSPLWSGAPAGAALAASDPALREELREYLKRQSELAAVQIEESRREDAIRHWGLRVRHISDVLKLGFELAVAFIVIAVAIGLGAVIWQAAHADGLVIDAVNVPAPLAEKGLSGQVVANKLLDRLTVMQRETDSSRAASTFANDWTHDITVQIPDTGVSLGQVVRFLDNWLGDQTHLSGDLYQTPSGVALTVRIGAEPGTTFDDRTGDLDAIVAKAAEAVFAQAQPYRYAVYLADKSRFAEAVAAHKAMAASGPPEEKAWADVGLAIIAETRNDIAGARAFVRAGRAQNPDLPNFARILSDLGSLQSHDEEQLRWMKAHLALLQGGGAKEWNPDIIRDALRTETSVVAWLHGDFRAAAADTVAVAGLGGQEVAVAAAGQAAIQMHDVALALSDLAALEADRADPSPQNSASLDAANQRLSDAVEMQDWAAAAPAGADAMAAVERIRAATGGWTDYTLSIRANTIPLVAYADARRGRFADADAILETLPRDCDLCLRQQGRVDALRSRWREAEAAFRAVAARSPDIPFAHTDWGQALLWKGDLGAAIAQFDTAHAIGPHFADPLEMWGEALIAQNRSDLALAKFEEAARYAPDWGRLHLQWGEALLWNGDKAGAAQQFDTAAALFLTAPDRATLARLRGGHG